VGLSVIQISGQAACVPWVSFDTSNEIVPVRPAKLNGCFAYIVSATTLPASNTPVALSLTDSRIWPLQMIMSLASGAPSAAPPQPCIVVGTQGTWYGAPQLLSPVQRLAPQITPFNWPARLPLGCAVSNVSQNAGVPPSCMPQFPLTGVGGGVDPDADP